MAQRDDPNSQLNVAAGLMALTKGHQQVPGAEDVSPKLQEEIMDVLDFIMTQHGTLRHAFERLDLNSNEVVTQSEWEAGLRAEGYQGNTRRVFHYIDKDGLGEVTEKDFRRLEPFLRLILSQVKARHERVEAHVHGETTRQALQGEGGTFDMKEESKLRFNKDDHAR